VSSDAVSASSRKYAAVRKGLQKARFDESVKRVDGGTRDGFCRVVRECAGEGAQPGEEDAELRAKQVVAPLDGRAKGSLAFRRVAWTCRQDREALVEPSEECGGVECP